MRNPRLRTASCWLQEHGLNEMADHDEFRLITRIINGGLNGYEDRKAKYETLKRLLS